MYKNDHFLSILLVNFLDTNQVLLAKSVLWRIVDKNRENFRVV